MNANLFAFCFFIDFSLSRGSLWKVVRAFWVGGYFNRLTSVILIRQRKVHFAETEESFLLLEMQPERVFQQLVFCFLPEFMCMLASSFASKRLLFCIATCQTLDWIRWGWLIWVLVRLLTQFFFSSSSMSHLKDDIFIKGIYLKFNMAPEAERGEVKINPALFYKGSIYMAPKNLRSLWRKLSKNFRQIKDRRKFSLCNWTFWQCWYLEHKIVTPNLRSIMPFIILFSMYWNKQCLYSLDMYTCRLSGGF